MRHGMRRLRVVPAIVVSATLTMLAGAPPAARAAVPETMSYQGVLTDAGGVPVPDGAYDLTFSLYDAPVGGTLLWSETQTGVPVQAGGFGVLLGSVTPFSLPFDAPFYLGIAVNPDPELEPRIPLASSPYALGVRLPLPADAVSATEIADEPGVAGSIADGIVGVFTSPVSVLSSSITVPRDGYVLAIGSCVLTYFHSAGTTDNMIVGLSTSASSMPADRDQYLTVGGSQPTDLHSRPVTVQSVFPVTAGTWTFHLLARKGAGGMNVSDRLLSLAWFPTSYGAVAAGAEAGATPAAGGDALDRAAGLVPGGAR